MGSHAIGSAAVLALLLFSGEDTSFAAEPWLARPLKLPTLGFSADVALGVGQTTAVDPTPKYDIPLGLQKPGAGLDFDAALGLPLGLEVGLRMGVRFGPSGALTNADAYGRLYDPIGLHVFSGVDSLTEPELRVREAFVDSDVAAFGFDIRLMLGSLGGEPESGTAAVVTPGIPLRLRAPHHVRLDTGVYFPVAFWSEDTWGLEIPVALWFEHEHFFWGPLTGLFWNNPATGTYRTEGQPTETEIHFGVGAGYTIGAFDLKAQVLTTRIDAVWSKYIGGGFGVGVVVP